jgi:hypothetical protein
MKNRQASFGVAGHLRPYAYERTSFFTTGVEEYLVFFSGAQLHRCLGFLDAEIAIMIGDEDRDNMA